MQMLYQRLQPLDPPLKENLLSQCHSLHRLQFPTGTALRSPMDAAEISPLGTLAELGEITGAIDSSPTALCWARPHPVLGTSTLLRA